jgi:phosphatidylglycerophosphate synthase
MNRNMSVLLRSRAELPATVPTEAQLLPPLVEYSHEPFPFVVAVIAIPSTALLSTSVMRSPPAEEIIEATVWPALAVLSSVIAVSVIVLVLSSNGASLTLVTVIWTVADCVEYAVVPPPEPGMA